MQDDFPPATDGNRTVYSLGQLSQALKKTVESVYDQVRVRAEISQPKRAASGHVYFTLKDDSSTLDAVCWKGVAAGLTTQPEEGLEVVVTGKLTTYAGRSKYQIVVQDVELAGEGALLRQLEERRKKLMAEGLFAPERKQPIPTMPQVIGVVTSPTGAVIRDILHRLRERFPVQVLVWPVLVQGQGAAEDIAAAIRGFDAMVDAPVAGIACPDLVIVARGGGSLEDLMAFNEEVVVRAAAECRLPLISGVGHETDTTLIDHAADRRAPTPTAAAEIATPVAADLQARLNENETRLLQALERRLEQAGQELRHLGRSLADPGMLMESKGQRLDIAAAGLDRRMDTALTRLRDQYIALAERLPTPVHQLAMAAERLVQLERRSDQLLEARLAQQQKALVARAERLTPPTEHLSRGDGRVSLAGQKLDHLMAGLLDRVSTRLDHSGRLLEASSFQRVLDRGFALVTGPDGTVMRSAQGQADGTAVGIRFADGTRDAVLGSGGASAAKPAQPKPRSKTAGKPDNPDQGNLF